MNVKFTSEDLKNIMKQPKDSCPHLNYVLQKVESENKNPSEKINVNRELDIASEIITNIIKWQKEWKTLFIQNEKLSDEDPFVLAYKETSMSLEMKEPFDLKEYIFNLKRRFDEFQDELNNKDISNDLVEFQENELKENELYIDMQKKDLTQIIEDIRAFAVSQRKIGQNYKDAYKQISIMNDFDDIIQPEEIIQDKKIKDVFILGILNNEKTTAFLMEKGIIDDVQAIIFERLDSDKKIEMIKEKIKQEYDVKSIAYFESLDDYQNNKEFKVTSLEKKQKKQLRRKM